MGSRPAGPAELAFDLKTGRERWRRPLGKELAQLSLADGRLFAFSLSAFMGRKRQLFIARLDPADGAEKWRVEPEGGSQRLDMAVVGNRINVMSLAMEVYDADTGDCPGGSGRAGPAPAAAGEEDRQDLMAVLVAGVFRPFLTIKRA